MPNPKGAVLTERDRALLSYLAIARYASAEQVHRLFFDGSGKKQTYRRLAKLCEPGARPGEGACLRRLQYRRRADGAATPVWALAPHGRAIAERAVPWLRPPATSDIGARFLEHTLVLNDILAGLVAALRRSPTAPLADLPFKWLSENDDALSFETFDRRTMSRHRAVLKPDAIMTIPGRGAAVRTEREERPVTTELRQDWAGAVRVRRRDRLRARLGLQEQAPPSRR
ncbi:MAG TPA: replication-relaxation family protein [Anaeromyxobacteraceae bacterium]|nr:replication-relaxation family protein [Anaeromyxobacteraceae bacterium]